MDIGDSFKIKKEYLDPVVKCKYPNKIFVIDHFSKSGYTLFYTDTRTSSKCDCMRCTRVGMEVYLDGRVVRSIDPKFVTIVETKIQRRRNLKLKSLNI